MSADVDVYDGFGYTHTPGKAWPWHLRKRTSAPGTGTAICGATVAGFRPEPVRREFLSETCKACAVGLARLLGGPKVDQVVRPRKGPREPHKWEAMLDQQLAALGLPLPVSEHRFFAPVRQWRLDRAWPEVMVAVEIEGGLFIGGRHTQGRGAEEDAVKYNMAALMGWMVLRASERHVRTGVAARWARCAIALRSSGSRYDDPARIPADLIPERFVSKRDLARRKGR